eukprot:CAMPEP_0170430206 /NCGR_PEP_ID=MMETSP0117_2-20130122/40732_1 /TAXON_ID=400756 /ORGANISM="Durinskia baltica, Strain CSIRO CS-38" /LENGTH=160 /DNA_ID=CAMNT_0010689655 /DNA_START=124 /DNA_END=603 /DNA_ORIENTATION=+
MAAGGEEEPMGDTVRAAGGPATRTPPAPTAVAATAESFKGPCTDMAVPGGAGELAPRGDLAENCSEPPLPADGALMGLAAVAAGARSKEPAANEPPGATMKLGAGAVAGVPAHAPLAGTKKAGAEPPCEAGAPELATPIAVAEAAGEPAGDVDVGAKAFV